jgi:uncharacterized protein YdbL (DUF1318 family)
MQTRMIRRIAVGAGAMLAMVGLAGAAFAQDYASAKAAGLIGEKANGYVAVVGSGSSALQKVVDDINIKRKAVYADRAQAQHATVEDYAFTAGCKLIAQTKPGEMYQAADGSWRKRTSAPPSRDARCP